jgi:threonine/homoserine/homoserine lactone efflux protein
MFAGWFPDTMLANLLAFAWTSLLIELTPGPNMTYLAVLALSEGRLAAVISESAVLYQGLRWAGVAYLLWLAWEGWRDGLDVTHPKLREEFDGKRYFRSGLITNLLNPKAAVFYVSILPLFVNRAAPAAMQTLSLTLTYVAIATVVHLSIVGLASSARPLLEDARINRMARRTLSLALAFVALWLAWSTRQAS